MRKFQTAPTLSSESPNSTVAAPSHSLGRPLWSIPEYLRASISNYLFLKESSGSHDIIVCLGCTVFERSAGRGIRMYKEGRCGKLLFTGGPNHKVGGNEATLMAQLALEAGVPIRDVLVDPCSTNTLENCLHTRAILKHYNVDSIAFVSIHYHSRRACETYRLVSEAPQLPAVIPYSSAFYNHHNWHRSERGRRDVIGEISRMASYLPERQCPEPGRFLDDIRRTTALWC